MLRLGSLPTDRRRASMTAAQACTRLAETRGCERCGSAQIVSFAVAREINRPALGGTAIGLVNAFVTGAGALYQPLIGWLLDLNWSGAMSGGARLYAVADYRWAFSVLLVGMGVSLACVAAMRETYCKPLA